MFKKIYRHFVALKVCLAQLTVRRYLLLLYNFFALHILYSVVAENDSSRKSLEVYT